MAAPELEELQMTIYRLGERTPVLPAEGSYWVAPGAHLIGDVEIGEGVGIWFGATVRGDNEPIRIGARTNIQDGAVLHSDFGAPLSIGAGCTIGHSAIIHGCTIGDNVLVGMGATILNRAVIGADSLVGANALVTEGKQFPPKSLIVGAPAKVVRELTDEEVAGLRRSADGYVANWQRFAKELEAL
jgi:carbonic anhydrase/acetyltransferase-like protein (isoleucine patch superfamily)